MNNPAASETWQETFHAQGFLRWPRALEPAALRTLIDVTERVASGQGAGVRRPELRDACFSTLAREGLSAELARTVLGPGWRPVRMILFDKTPGANWHVAWHQDPCIAVRERADCAGFAGWSVKSGVTHVQPPADLLAGMLTLRYHLDDTPETNGALRVIPGSHDRGRIPEAALQGIVEAGPVVTCSAQAGDLLLMRPLLLHSSNKSTAHAAHRRVVHIEYAGMDLPPPLAWYGIS